MAFPTASSRSTAPPGSLCQPPPPGVSIRSRLRVSNCGRKTAVVGTQRNRAHIPSIPPGMRCSPSAQMSTLADGTGQRDVFAGLRRRRRYDQGDGGGALRRDFGHEALSVGAAAAVGGSHLECTRRDDQPRLLRIAGKQDRYCPRVAVEDHVHAGVNLAVIDLAVGGNGVAPPLR